MSRAWQLLIYAMVGSDEEQRGIEKVIADMRGALRGEQRGDRCAVVVQVNGKDAMQRYWLTRGGYVEEPHEWVNSGSPEALTGFLDAGCQRLGGERTALVVWAHGEGVDTLTQGRWRAVTTPRRLGPQWGTNDFLTNDEVRDAIARSALTKVDLLAFNACVMGLVEVAYEMRAVADVLVFSQLFARTWPYGEIVGALSEGAEQSASQVGELIVSQVRDDAVSAIASSALEEVFEEIDGYAALVTPLVATSWGAVREAVMAKAQRVHDPYQVDLISLLEVLGAEDEQAAGAAGRVIARLRDAAIVGSAALESHPRLSGLSIFCPKSTTVDLDAAYSGFAFRKNRWKGFLRAFQDALQDEAVAPRGRGLATAEAVGGDERGIDLLGREGDGVELGGPAS